MRPVRLEGLMAKKSVIIRDYRILEFFLCETLNIKYYGPKTSCDEGVLGCYVRLVRPVS
jgi:hypothetical protein